MLDDRFDLPATSVVVATALGRDAQTIETMEM